MIPDSVVKLARKLGEWLPPPLKKSLFVNTGSEANEAALRIAKLATGGYEVIALGGSWHGTTGASAAASYASDRRGYGPKVPGGHVIPEPNAYRCPVEHCRDRCDMTCLKIGLRMFDMASDGAPAALIAEPVISAGGVIVPPEGLFRRAAAEACDERGMLLVFDEAQTAFGRIGDRFAATKLGVTPDILSVSKTLGGGVPLAATSPARTSRRRRTGKAVHILHLPCLRPDAGRGRPCGAGDVESEELIPRAVADGRLSAQGARDLQQRYEAIGDVRGEGCCSASSWSRTAKAALPFHALGAATTARCFELGL